MGKTSSREAVIAIVNANSQSDTIQLQARRHYMIDFCDAAP